MNLNSNPFELAGALLTHEGYGVAVQETDTALLEALDRLILGYQQQGFLQDLHRKWFSEAEPVDG